MRLATNEVIRFDKEVTLYLPSPSKYPYAVYRYDSYGQFLTCDSSWNTNQSITISPDTMIRVKVRESLYTTWDDETVTTYSKAVKIISQYQDVQVINRDLALAEHITPSPFEWQIGHFNSSTKQIDSDTQNMRISCTPITFEKESIVNFAKVVNKYKYVVYEYDTDGILVSGSDTWTQAATYTIPEGHSIAVKVVELTYATWMETLISNFNDLISIRDTSPLF